jgi:hypothetical protein
LGKLDLDPPRYHKWAKKYNDATCAIQNRAQKMADVAEEIERDLGLVGTTATLQEGVPREEGNKNLREGGFAEG